MSEEAGNRENRGENSPEGKKKLHVLLRTFGCQMNIRDSEMVAGLFLEGGWKLAESQDKADVILFNTCSVRAHAEERVWGNIGMLRKLKEKRPDLIIGVIGCMAQRIGSDFFKRSNLVDIACGPSDEENLPGLVEEFIKTRQHILSVSNIGQPRKEVFLKYRNSRGAKFCASTPAYVNISHGCDNFCSYCIVPYVRGKEISRRPEDIIREIRMLAKRGVKEITLLGQNVNSYGRDTHDFVKLLKEINKIGGIERIEFMTSHPKDAGEDLFKAMADLPKAVKHLHLPLQSGSDKILKAMNRGYTAKKYLSLTEKLREIIPGCSLTTDIIVGFPGETEEDFKKTFDLMKKIEFGAAYIFKYSPRPPAASAKLKDDVPQEEKERRNQALIELLKSNNKG